MTPYPEDDIPKLVEELDGDDRILVFGSDFPHAEGVVQAGGLRAALGIRCPRTCSGASSAGTPRSIFASA